MKERHPAGQLAARKKERTFTLFFQMFCSVAESGRTRQERID